MYYLEDAFVRPLVKKEIEPLRDRADAGRKLAKKLVHHADQPEVLVLGLARGGLPVAYEIATALHAPLDVLIVRKLGVPGHEELAMGAIASGGIRVMNEDIVEHLAIPRSVVDDVTKQELRELLRRERVYRGDQPTLDVYGKTVILVDDGIATGATLRTAIAALQAQKPERIVVAVGVAPPETYRELVGRVDELVCLLQPEPFWGVGLWFRRFSQTTDEEVRTLLDKAKSQME
ncbi:phosphoribosyltransferase [Chloroflexi bacterium TSY]|nr:phosphoribosyltransferase [Chloroflexi bacterium TSY]